MSGMSRENIGKSDLTCDLCGRKISKRVDTMYDGLCKKCFEKEEEDSDGLYEV